MVNTSNKNAFSKRNHRERGQLLHRAKLGNLEKHKDYVHRARDYKSKQDRIRKLREKAAFRNKDEFYYGMVKGQTKNGMAIGERGNEALSTDVVKILKSQDAGYVRICIAKDEKRIDRLRRELEASSPQSGEGDWDAAAELAEVEKLAEMGIVLKPRDESSSSRKGKGKAAPSGHVIFVDGREEFEQWEDVDATPSTNGAPAEEVVDLGWADPKPSGSKPKKPLPSPAESEETDRSHRMDLLTELSALLGRVKQLRIAAAKLETTKGMMGKGAARKVRENGWVEDENAPEDRNGDKKRWEGKMWKWKLERKR